LLIARSINDGDARLAGVDVYCMVCGFFVQPNLNLLVVTGVGGDFGGIERVDM
jgi:hypothetical protein